MGGFDWTLGVGRIVSTDLKGPKRVLVANIEGIDGETSNQQIMYSALGVVARPLDADANGSAEPIYARTEDGLIPLTYRDPRLSAVTNPKKGEVMLPHYDGGFISLKRNAAGDGTDFVVYAPKADGSKASAISIDTTNANSNITIMHDSGVSVQWADAKVVVYNRSGDGYVQVDDDGVTINGNVKVNGGMVVGSPAGGVPVALATPLTAWAAAMNDWATLMNTWATSVNTALGGAAPAPPPPAPPALASVATTKLSASP